MGWVWIGLALAIWVLGPLLFFGWVAWLRRKDDVTWDDE